MSKGQTLQDPFLNSLRKDRIPVSIFLVNGIKLQGQIESFDQYVVLLKNTVSQMVYKHAISTVVPARNPRSTTPMPGASSYGQSSQMGFGQAGGFEQSGYGANRTGFANRGGFGDRGLMAAVMTMTNVAIRRNVQGLRKHRMIAVVLLTVVLIAAMTI